MSLITPAASVLLSRGPGSREVFAILRGQHLKFFGGFWAFPGGKLAEQDATGSDSASRACRITACRELFEETGVLIARRSDGSFPAAGADLDACRRELLAETLSFGKLLDDRQLTVHDADFPLIGEITTPPFSHLRYATTFFTAYVPDGQEPVIWAGELEAGAWLTSAELLARWRRGECFVTPPTVMALETLGAHAVDDLPRLLAPAFTKLAAGSLHPIFFAPCVQVLPLKTAALPPSACTNAILIGNGPRYLIDPGPDDTQEQERLFEVVNAAGPLAAVVLTHHHPDHVGAAGVCAARYQVPIWAHPRTAERLAGRLTIDRLLNEGEQLDLGPCPADGSPWRLDVLHTPGHAWGHLVFFEPFYRMLLAGDMLSTMTSMVISPPDGDLGVYLDSLRRLRDLPARMVIPAHGSISMTPRKLCEDALEHRAKRERQLVETLRDGPASVEILAERMYRSTPEILMRFARAQTLAGLLKLQEEGRAHPEGGERWALE